MAGPTTTTNQATGEQQPPTTDPADYEKMVKRVADKVWEMWREELRRERERRGGK
jgi:hypothetical protein